MLQIIIFRILGEHGLIPLMSEWIALSIGLPSFCSFFFHREFRNVRLILPGVMAVVDAIACPFPDDDPVGRGEAEDLRAEADLPLDVLLAKYRTPGGSAKNLRKKENFQSPVVRAKKNSSDMEAGPSSSSDTMDAKSADSCEVKAAGSSSSCLTNGLADNENNLNKERELQDSARSCSSTDGGDSSGMVTDSGSSVGGSSPCEGGTTQTACGESGDSGKSVVHVADSSTGEAGGSGGCSSSSSSSSGVCDVGSSSSGSSGQSSKFSDASSFGDVSSSSSSVSHIAKCCVV